jgi:hypothetical protein
VTARPAFLKHSPRALSLAERDEEARNRRSQPDYHRTINDSQACGCALGDPCNAHRPDCLCCGDTFTEDNGDERSLVTGLCVLCAKAEAA